MKMYLKKKNTAESMSPFSLLQFEYYIYCMQVEN